MISYAAHQTGMAVAHGIASEPWEWLVDYKPIAYLTIDPAHPGALVGDHPAVHFLGLVSPPILLAGVVGMALVLWTTLRPQARAGAAGDRPAASRQPVPWLARSSGGDLLRVSAAWFLGTFGPFLIAGLAFNRTSYLYYMTIVMPGLYIAGAWLAGGLRDRPWVFWPWVLLVAASAVVLYPFTPLP